MFKKILIANRGEIAMRIIRACRELSIRTAAIYADCDSTAIYVKKADESHLIPGPVQGFLDMRGLVDLSPRSSSWPNAALVGRWKRRSPMLPGASP